MTHIANTVVAVVTDAALAPDPELGNLSLNLGEVYCYDDPAMCLAEFTQQTNALFVVDARMAQDAASTWITILAASGIGPVVCVGDVDEACAQACLDAGADECLPKSALNAGPEMCAAFARRLIESHGLRRRDLSAELESFVRDSIHEFRTPLTAVHEFAAIIDDGLGGPVTEKQSEYLGYVLAGTDRMLGLFDDFRDSLRARLGTLALERSSGQLQELVEEVVAEAATDRVRYSLTIDPAAGQVNVDAELLSRTIDCLLQRAAKCSPRGSEVQVEVCPVGDEVEIRVTDQAATPTVGDMNLLLAGTLDDGLQRKSVTKVFGIGIELARALLGMHGSELTLSKEASGTGGTLSFRISNSPAAVAVS
jgi:hypothetical protein